MKSRVPAGVRKRLEQFAKRPRPRESEATELGKAREARIAEPVPNRLDLDVDPPALCKRYQVYFNGVKQTLCHVADVREGYILRYKLGIGRLPVKNRQGKYETEFLKGRVEICHHGVAPKGDLSKAPLIVEEMFRESV